MAQIQSILCPVDFSDTSEAALRFAFLLAERFGAEVHVLHIQQLGPDEAESGARALSDEIEASARLEIQLRELADRFAVHEVKVVPKLRRGAVYREVVEEAKRSGADLIVMGTHGRTGLEHLLLGSVAERVVRLSPVPVTTVPPLPR